MRTNPSHKAQFIRDAAQEEMKGPFCLVLSSSPHSETPSPQTQKMFPFRASLSNALLSLGTAKCEVFCTAAFFLRLLLLAHPHQFHSNWKPPKIPILAYRGHINLEYEKGRWQVWECSGLSFLLMLSWHHSSYFLRPCWNRVKATVTVRSPLLPSWQ